MDEKERVARRYCELIGADPEQMVAHGPKPKHGVAHAVLLHSPLWKLLADEVPHKKAWFQALSESSEREKLATLHTKRE